MSILFFVFALGVIMALPIHFMSVEHTKLQEKYGKEKGAKIGESYGRVSADLLFFSLIGIWLSPQPRFTVPIFQTQVLRIPVFNFTIPLFHLIVFTLFVLLGVWFLIQSVTELSRKVSETHRAEKVIATGIYLTVRHPQHLGWFLVHIGFSFLVSGWYALISTPFIFISLYLISRKEETELTKDFGKDYEEYMKKVPMLIPKIRK